MLCEALLVVGLLVVRLPLSSVIGLSSRSLCGRLAGLF